MTINDIDAGNCGDPKTLRRRIAEVIAPGSFGSSPTEYGWKDDEDGWFRFSNTAAFSVRVAALNRADGVIESFPQIAIEKNHPYEDAVSAIMFATKDDGNWTDALDDNEAVIFLDMWKHGDWTRLDIEFPKWREFLKGSGVNVGG